jgi:hypothetical protein
MHIEGVHVCAATFVPASARALVAVPAHAGAVRTTAVMTAKSVACTSGITG